MNLHGLVRGAVQVVNPDVPVTVRRSTGATQDDTGRTVPGYASAVDARGQRQALSGKDIMFLNGLNVQGCTDKMYLYGNIEGLVRADGRGGDLITCAGHVYKVGAVLERWPDWCALALIMQLDSPIT